MQQIVGYEKERNGSFPALEITTRVRSKHRRKEKVWNEIHMVEERGRKVGPIPIHLTINTKP